MAMQMFTNSEMLPQLFRRCYKCDDTNPTCPVCPEGQICSKTQPSCWQCASTQCIPISQSGATNPGQIQHHGSGPNIGAIAGGAVGGVLAIVVCSFLIWKYWLKGKRLKFDEDYEFSSEKLSVHDPTFGVHRSARASTHTFQSTASTVLTRASNIIQIAYIPGVTNRSTAPPGSLAPPVPPIPSASGPSSPYHDSENSEDQVFFTAGDLRGSTYSGMSGYTDDPSRNSIAPSLARSSVATTIYRGQAQVSPLPAPTQTMVRGKAAMVSVNAAKASGRSTPTGTPPVPDVDYATHSVPGPNGVRTIQVKMPAGSDALGGPSGTTKPVTVGAKPIALNIIKKRPGFGRANTSPDAEDDTTSKSIAEAVSKAAASSSSPTTIPRGPGLGLGIRQLSVAGSIDSGTSHARARQIDADTTEAESSDDEDEDAAGGHHARSRRSLLGGGGGGAEGHERSPFADEARIGGLEATATKGGDRAKGKTLAAAAADEDDRASPFEDSHAVKE